MQKIKVLSENMSNMIAAGEVVERPFSVVKELVENAIDAESSRIDISVHDGGKRAIRVADNGEGMSRDDALLSLERHATSKISDPADLFSITTMGFRGEALASIGSVSKMTVSTRERDAIEGTEIIAEGGVIRDVRAAGLPQGTIVEVKALFFNTPARKKFMKTTITEMGHISDYVARTALAFPSIAFTLRTESSSVFDIPSGHSLKERVVALLGRDDTASLLEVGEETAEMKLSGFISPPSIQRSTASGLYIYVNGRFVRDKVIRHALLRGYDNLIMRGKYPLAILFLEIDPAAVDVNVHPAKSEVKFRDSKQVHSLVGSAVEKTLQKREWLGEGGRAVEGQPERIESIREAAAEYVTKNEMLPLAGGYVSREEKPLYREPRTDAGAKRPPVDVSGSAVAETGPDERPESASAPGGYFSSLNVVGQVGEMYILCEGESGMVVIDQHAAYERIAFEELKAGYEGRPFDVQQLLVPETIELAPKEASAIEENIGDIQKLGFEIEHFGGRSFVVKAVPSILGTKGVRGIIADMASELAELPASKRFENVLDDILKRAACHAVVRGRRRMSHDEMRSLLKRMDASGIVPHCPHGRPAHIDIPITEIEKRFERT